MAACDYDLFVIGAGSGGARAARLAAQAGLKTGIADDLPLGGTCVNVGCVPKKLFSYAARFSGDRADALGYGWRTGDLAFDWPTLRANKDAAIARLNTAQATGLDRAGVDLHRARVRLRPDGSLDVGGRVITAANILIATGGRPYVPDIPGREHVVTSDEIFSLASLPRRIVIVGGGYIAVEFAAIFHGLGVAVTQLYRGSLFLRGFDDDVRRHLADEMVRSGIDLRFERGVVQVEKTPTGLRVCLEGGEAVDADLVLYATGRTANTSDLDLEGAGVELNADGSVKVDDYFCTTRRTVFALGDVIGGLQLTPVAIAQARVFVHNITGKQRMKMDYAAVPTAVFSHPNIGVVGLTEAEARRNTERVDVYMSRFCPLKSLVSGSQERALVKLVVDGANDRVMGVHVVAPEAGEIVQGFAVAVKAGVTKAQFDATLAVHPTLAEELVTLSEKRA